jgi:hypothetical protein
MDRGGLMGLRSIGLPEILVIVSIAFLLAPLRIIPFWKILSKAGYPGVMSLLWLVPVLNVVALWIFAFVECPALSGPNGRNVTPPSLEQP